MNNLGKNFIYGRPKGVSILLRLIMAMLFLVSMGTSMTSCGKDEKHDEPEINTASDIYGIWVANVNLNKWEDSEAGPFETKSEITSTILFNSQGQLLREENTHFIAQGGAATTIWMDLNSSYKVIDDNLIVSNVTNGTHHESVLSYKVIGNSLILEYVSGDKAAVLLGDNKITYTNKSKADIIEYPYGYWKATLSTGSVKREFSLTFNMDNNLSFSEKKQGNSYVTLESYEYEFTGNTLKVYEKDKSTTTPYCILSYKVIDNKITLEYTSGEKPLFISVFEKDTVTFTK